MAGSLKLPPRAALTALILAVCVAGGCSGSVQGPVYRDLADIPERPDVTPTSMNQQAVQNLKEERAKTMDAAEMLRNEPVTSPAPAPPLPAE